MRRSRNTRPGYVSVICYLLLFWGGVGLLITGMSIYSEAAKNPEEIMPMWLNVVCAAAAVVEIVCALFMRKGKDWARLLFYAAVAPMILIARIILTANMPTTADTIVNTVFSFVLVTISYVALSMERANRFFTGRDTFFKEQGQGSAKRESRTRGNFDY